MADTIEVDVTEMYSEACRALGDAIVRERVYHTEIARLRARVAELETPPDALPTVF